jgi:hypothetical protein
MPNAPGERVMCRAESLNDGSTCVASNLHTLGYLGS